MQLFLSEKKHANKVDLNDVLLVFKYILDCSVRRTLGNSAACVPCLFKNKLFFSSQEMESLIRVLLKYTSLLDGEIAQQ